jgi:hypothetical protein
MIPLWNITMFSIKILGKSPEKIIMNKQSILKKSQDRMVPCDLERESKPKKQHHSIECQTQALKLLSYWNCTVHRVAQSLG